MAVWQLQSFVDEPTLDALSHGESATASLLPPPVTVRRQDGAGAHVPFRTVGGSSEPEAQARHGHAHSHVHSHAHSLTPEERARMNSFESLDFEPWYSDAIADYEASHSGRYRAFRSVARWMAMLWVGVLTGVVAFGIFMGVTYLSRAKFWATLELLDSGAPLVAVYAAYAGWASVSVGIAAALVVGLAPEAGGSGIPEIKCYLNGSNIPRILRLKTILVKVFGVVLSVSGGLLIGKEGPLVHAGSGIAANLTHLPKIASRAATPATRKWWQVFRSDAYKRDFVSAGCAAGVGAAFGAPVGGILFSFEEASSYWTLDLTWRAFFCCLVSTTTLIFFRSGISGSWDDLTSSGLITFGEFAPDAYKLWELIPFIGLAIVGGLLGAAFNTANVALCKWRRDNLKPFKMRRIAEAVAVAWLTATISFMLPVLVHSCRPLPTGLEAEDLEHYHQFRCGDGEYSAMASALFNTQEDAIKGFFHVTVAYPREVLAIVMVMYLFLAAITYGLAVPSGLFVPAIMCGCALGRLVGESMVLWFPHSHIDAGVYALVGATAMLGGCTRMTISLTVILIEVTNDIQMVLPIMIVVIVSKWVGDSLSIAIYDMHLEINNYPFVENAPPAHTAHMVASDIMTSPPLVLPVLAPVGTVADALVGSTHNGFPVVSPDGSVLSGLILRSHLLVLLKARTFCHILSGPDGERALDPVQDAKFPHILDFAPSLSSKSNALAEDLAGVALRPGDREAIIDLRPYMNRAPFRVLLDTPVPRVYRLFRSMGLRHLCVVDGNNVVRGVVTRKDLSTDFTNDLW